MGQAIIRVKGIKVDQFIKTLYNYAILMIK